MVWRTGGSLFLLNISASLPPGIYLVISPRVLRHGMLVVFPPPATVIPMVYDRGYVPPQTPLLKPIAALPGDTVCVQDDGLFINTRYIGPVATVDQQGRPLPRQRGCFVVHETAIFPASTFSAQSFDGRYFGPIAITAIQGVARPLWTW
jgi:conjugative transfer signal peptidase TraF